MKPKQNVTTDWSEVLGELSREFPNDEACLEYIKELRWPKGVVECRKCGIERKHYRVTGRTAYACDRCGNHAYPLMGTVFAKSATSLKTWFYVIALMASTSGELSAREIQRETGVTYKTAWRLCRQVRVLLAGGGQPLGRSPAEPQGRAVHSLASSLSCWLKPSLTVSRSDGARSSAEESSVSMRVPHRSRSITV
jgi:transposase-like protein